MTEAEWIEVVKELRAQWPHSEIPKATIAAWYRDVADLPFEQVMAAARTFARDGVEWVPTGGKLRKRVAELVLDAPDWSEVLEQLREIQRAPVEKVGRLLNPDDLDADVEVEILRPRDAVVARTHPMIVAFLLHVGSQVAMGVDANDGGAEARLREKWFAFQRTAERRLSYMGLECADLPALERAVRRDHKLQEAAPVFAGIRDQIARQLPEHTQSTREDQ